MGNFLISTTTTSSSLSSSAFAAAASPFSRAPRDAVALEDEGRSWSGGEGGGTEGGAWSFSRRTSSANDEFLMGTAAARVRVEVST